LLPPYQGSHIATKLYLLAFWRIILLPRLERSLALASWSSVVPQPKICLFSTIYRLLQVHIQVFVEMSKKDSLEVRDL